MTPRPDTVQGRLDGEGGHGHGSGNNARGKQQQQHQSNYWQGSRDTN